MSLSTIWEIKKKREKTDYDCLVFLFYSLLLLYTKNWRHDIATFSPKMWVLKSFLLKNLKEIYNITLELILILPWSKSIALTKDLTIQPWLFGVFMHVYINIKSWICHKDLFSWLLRIFFYFHTQMKYLNYKRHLKNVIKKLLFIIWLFSKDWIITSDCPV